MADTRTIAYYAMYVIGEVESNWSWTSASNGALGEGLTIGMMQWYGTRAAGLLFRIKTEASDLYPTLAVQLRNRMDAHGADDSYWNGLHISQYELDTIVTVFGYDDAHLVQENQAIEDFTAYIPTLTAWGASVDSPQALVFCMSMYHQSPARCQIVMQGSNPQDLDTIFNACLADSVLGQYVNRYTTNYNRLKAWDGESEPPDFGQIGSADGSTYTDVGMIIQSGNCLVLYGKGLYSDGILFYPTASCYVCDDTTDASWIIPRGDNLVLYGDRTLSGGVVFYASTAQTWVSSLEVSEGGGGSGEPPDPEGGGARESTDGRLWWPSNTAAWTTYSNHRAVDIPAAMGDGVYAAADGTVVYSGTDYDWSYGNYIRIYHESLSMQTAYAHMNSRKVNAGDKVVKGQEIGETGSTGNSSGPHLHFEIYDPAGSGIYDNANRKEASEFGAYFKM